MHAETILNFAVQ